jgi:hypothetical protein
MVEGALELLNNRQQKRRIPTSERPLPFLPDENSVATPLLRRGSSSRGLRPLLEALPLRISSDRHPRFAAMASSHASSLARNTKRKIRAEARICSFGCGGPQSTYIRASGDQDMFVLEGVVSSVVIDVRGTFCRKC